MKKLSLVCFLLLSCLLMNAKNNPLRLQEGSLTSLKNCGGLITCKFDFSKTKSNKKSLKEYIEEDTKMSFESFKRTEPEMLTWFMERWDDDIEEGPKATTSDDAQFKVDIIIKNLTLGSNSGYGAASISGKALFYKKGENEPFAVVEILKMNGTMVGAGVPGYIGLKQSFNDLAEYLCDLIYHSK